MPNKNIKIGLLKKGISIIDSLNEGFQQAIQKNNDFNFVLDEKTYQINASFIDKFTQDVLENGFGKKLRIAIFKIVKIDGSDRIYVISVGDTRTMFEQDVFENNFGMKLGLNDLISKGETIKLKEITTKDKIDGDNFRHSKNAFSELGQFTFKSLTEVLKEVKIKNEIKGVKSLWSLNNFLNITIPDGIEPVDLFNLIEKFITKNMNEGYKEEFGFIDNFINVDEEQRKKLDDKLKSKLNNKEDISLAWPKFEDTDHDHYKVKGLNKRYYIVDREILLDIYNADGRTRPENVLVSSCDSNGNEKEKFKLWKLIYDEVEMDGKSFSIHEGAWVGISDSLKTVVEKMFSAVVNKKWEVEVEPWASNIKNENAYNKYLAKKHNWVMLDTELMTFDTYDKLEIADLAFTDKNTDTLVAVKQLHNSSSISHLVNQVKNAIKAMKHDPIAVESFLRTKSGSKDSFNVSNMKIFVLLIAVHKFKDGIPKVPFFAKMVLGELGIDQLNGVELKYKFIQKNNKQNIELE